MLKSLLNIALILLIFLSTVGYAAYQLTKPAFLVAQAEDVHLYQQATAQVGSLIPKESLSNLPLSADQIEKILAKAVSSKTFYQELEAFSTAYLSWLTSRTDQLSYQLNLAPIKKRLSDAAAAQLIVSYQNLPSCQTADLKTWDATAVFPSCQLPTTNVQSKDVNRLLTAQAAALTDQLPDRWSTGTPSQGLTETRERVTSILQLIQITWLLTLGFTLLYALVGRRKAFLSLAFIFLVAGLLEVAFSFFAWDWLKRFLVDLLSSPGQSQAIVTVTATLIEDIIQTLKTILGNLSIITLSIGGLFIILWAFTRFSRPKDRMEIPRR